MNTHVIHVSAREYPEALSRALAFPPTLYVRGDLSALARPCVAVVGTREATYAGLHAARHIAGAVARAGFVVVSGLALGIDGDAHRECLDARGVTVAVMAHGLDMVYPREHRDLAARILACGGALVSEWPDGTEPAPWRFPQRNRIQSGLSACVVVVECGPQSGTMYTAEHAHRQKRPVIAVQSRSDAPALRTSGGAELVRAGRATPAHSVAEVMAAVCVAVNNEKTRTEER